MDGERTGTIFHLGAPRDGRGEGDEEGRRERRGLMDLRLPERIG